MKEIFKKYSIKAFGKPYFSGRIKHAASPYNHGIFTQT